MGRLHHARGIRGELVGEIYSSQPGRAEKLKEVRLDTGSRQRLTQVERVWNHQGRPVFKFAGIDSMSDAELWHGADILVPESERAKPEEGEYSHADLIGCRVLSLKTGADGLGELVGTVAAVAEYGGPPLLELEGPDGREILVPFVRSICREIDVESKVIRAELPEGLTDLP